MPIHRRAVSAGSALLVVIVAAEAEPVLMKAARLPKEPHPLKLFEARRF